jgi:hypothetical protein
MSVHLEKVHGVGTQLVCPLCNASMPSKEIWSHAKACQNKTKRKDSVSSDNKKGKTVTKRVFCEKCGRIGNVTRCYSKNNKGTARICDACKKKPFHKTDEKFDALDRAFQGGSFEMNRRRH